MTLPLASPRGPTPTPNRWLLMVGGPAAMGTALGLTHGATSVVLWTAALPLIILGVGAVMLPALYVGANLLGPAPAAQTTGSAAFGALGDTGALLLGLAPAQAFLGVASAAPNPLPLTGCIFVALSATLGLRSLYHRLIPEASRGQRLLFTLWALVCLGIGFAFFLEVPL